MNTIIHSFNKAKEKGFRSISTYVSSNNRSALAAHMALGYTIKDMSYVFVKHKH